MKKWLLKTVTGTVIVSIIGAALWENIIKPSSGWLLGIAVSLTTFGLRSFQNGIYLEIAKGFHEDVSLRIMLTMYSLLLGLSTSLIIFYFIIKKYGNKEGPKNARIHSPLDPISNNKFFLPIIITFCIVFFFFDLSRSIYINQAVTYYKQLKTIVLPYLADQNSRSVDSSFAQIQSSEDYQKIVQSLEQIISENKLTLPVRPSVLTVVKYQSF